MMRTEADKLDQFPEVLKAAIDLFNGDEAAVREWLSKPAKALGGQEPLSMLKTHAGTEDVLNLIGRLGHGVIA